jgi:dienelactone hydrolase
LRFANFIVMGSILLVTACTSTTKAMPVPTETPAATRTPSSTETAAPTPTATVLPSPTPGLALPEPQKFEFETKDHKKLAGFFYPAAAPNAPVVVLMHMAGGKHQDWEKTGVVQWLLNQGIDNPHPYFYPPLPEGLSFAVFAFDLRGHGESEGDAYSPLYEYILDAKAAYERAARLPGVDASRIAGIGASVGADAVVDGCTICIGALSLSPGNYLNPIDFVYSDVIDQLDSKGVVVWCLAGKNDRPAVDACTKAHGMHYRSILYEGGHHGTVMVSVDDAPEGAGQAVYDWLMETLRQ